MPDATGNSLVMAGAFGSFDLLGNPNWRIAAGTKWDLGAAQPDISVIVGDLLSGDRVSGSRSGNRTIVLPLLLTAADRITVAANLNPLLRTVDCQPPNESFTLTWTPAGGLPVTFDCYRGSYQRTRSLSLENAGGTLVTLTFAAAPFGRSNAPVTVAAASPQLQIDSLDTAPTNATLDTTNKYEGTGSAAVTLTRQSLTTPRGTSYWYTSPTVSHPVSAAATSISDNFNRANSTTSLGTASDGGTWTVDPSGVYGITGNKAYLVSGANTNARARRNTGQVAADVTVTDARANTNGFSYIWFAYNPTTDTGYYVQFDSGNVNAFGVYKWVSGVATQIGTNLFVTASWTGSTATLRVTYNPSTGVIEVFQGGVSRGTRTDGTPITGTSNTWVGMSASQANSSTGETWEDFTAAAVAVSGSVDLTPYASIGHRFRWPAPAFAKPWTAILTLTVSDGTHSASAFVSVTVTPGSTTWYLPRIPISSLSSGAAPGGSPLPMPNLAAITSWTWSLATLRQTLTSGTALPAYTPPGSGTANIDDIRLFPLSSTAISTGTGAVVTVPAVIGTAPAPASLTVTESGGSMTNLLLHRPPVDQSPDAAILAALSGTPKTATIAAANNTFKGTYSVVLLIGTVGSGSRTVSVQFDHKQGSTTLASQTVSTSYTTPTGKFAIVRDYITLPLVPVPDENTTDTLVITVTSSGVTPDTFTDVALIDTRGQLALLGALPSGTTTVYIDEPDPIGELGQIYASATDRTAATGQLGWGAQTRVGSGPIILEPGDNRLLAASPDGVVPTIILTYDPRWLDERDQ